MERLIKQYWRYICCFFVLLGIWYLFSPLTRYYFNQYFKDFVVPPWSFAKGHVEEIASAITIFLGVIALNEYCEYYKKRRRLREFLDHCDKISVRISNVLEICSNSKLTSKEKYDAVIKELEIILKDKKEGLDVLNETFVASKISRLMDIGVSVNELMELKNMFNKDVETMKKGKGGIDSLLEELNNTPQGSRAWTDAEEKLNKGCDRFNENTKFGLIRVNDEIRRMYNKIATMFKVSI